MQYIRLLLFYSVIFQSCKFQSPISTRFRAVLLVLSLLREYKSHVLLCVTMRDNGASQAERPSTSAAINFTRFIYIIMHVHSWTGRNGSASGVEWVGLFVASAKTRL